MNLVADGLPRIASGRHDLQRRPEVLPELLGLSTGLRGLLICGFSVRFRGGSRRQQFAFVAHLTSPIRPPGHHAERDEDRAQTSDSGRFIMRASLDQYGLPRNSSV